MLRIIAGVWHNRIGCARGLTVGDSGFDLYVIQCGDNKIVHIKDQNTRRKLPNSKRVSSISTDADGNLYAVAIAD